MNYASQQELYDFIKQADNSNLWSSCGTIAKRVARADRTERTVEENRTKEETKKAEEKKKENSLNPPISIDVATLTDAELRTHVKQHLVNKLTDSTLSGSDIGQLKDIFGLASKTEDLTIQVVDYANAIIDCPHCGENVHRDPSTD